MKKWENQEERPEKILAAAEIELERLKTERSILENPMARKSQGREISNERNRTSIEKNTKKSM